MQQQNSMGGSKKFMASNGPVLQCITNWSRTDGAELSRSVGAFQ